MSYSQKETDAHIFGHVVNKKTKEHLSYLHVVLKGTSIGTSTDATGHYFLKNMPLGKYIIIASGIGYKAQEIEVEIKANTSMEVDFELEEDPIMLESIVVSASRNEVRRKEAPIIVNVINASTFESTNSMCLAQGLSFQPGLRVENNCQNCGFQQVRINGLDGPYSQILIDSRPVFSSLASVYGLEQIPANMIERVEIVRGGGSALFGSNAIAGTINIITKEPNFNTVSLANTINFINGRSLDANSAFNASVVSDNHKAGVMLFGASRTRNSYDHTNDGFSELPGINSSNIGFKGYYRSSNQSKLTAEFHRINEFRRGGNNIDLPPHQADIAEQVEHNIKTGSINFDLFSKDLDHRFNIFTSLQAIERKSYYGANKDLNAYGQTEDLSLVTGLQYSSSFKRMFFMPADLTMGAEYNFNDMSDRALGYGRSLDQQISIGSFFLQNEWRSKKWSILLGSRFDQHNQIANPIISPRTNLRYAINDNISLRGSFSTGFRAPQTFEEDLHIGTTGGDAILIQIDPDLKTEKSISYSASADFYKAFGKIQTNLLIEGFYTLLNNVFVLEEIGKDVNNNILIERRNGSGAIVQGINIESRIIPMPSVQLQMGVTFQKSEYMKEEQWSQSVAPQRRLYRTPNTYGFFTISYNYPKNWNIALSGIYTGSMLVQHYEGYISEDREVNTPEFMEINLRIAYDFLLNGQSKLTLNAGIQNILNSYQQDFDKGMNKDAGYVYGPGLPRTFFVGARFSL